MRILTTLSATALAIAVGLGAAPGQARAAERITCASDDGQHRYCPADTRNGVRLSHQLSRAACRQDESWGYDRRGVWVANGCRAEFELDDGGRHGSASHDDHAAAAIAVALIGAAAIAANHERHEDQRRRDDERYRQDDRYRYDDRYRDDDRWDDARLPTGGGDGQTLVTCASEDGHYRSCPARVGRGRVDIQRQLSRAECRFGRDWGYDGHAIYVDNGCRAEFVVRD